MLQLEKYSLETNKDLLHDNVECLWNWVLGFGFYITHAFKTQGEILDWLSYCILVSIFVGLAEYSCLWYAVI